MAGKKALSHAELVELIEGDLSDLECLSDDQSDGWESEGPEPPDDVENLVVFQSSGSSEEDNNETPFFEHRTVQPQPTILQEL
ncbi:hypothetical protein Zmor_004572 [Zophobas morio]|uniref:Uncharacterized protein n=1 Tax=Zophobas morio TaxID=2755281 RepID=A0AA38IUI9_9CUCU|nr:hypothetical protein Zmor_004572 [Zophobas morio]